LLDHVVINTAYCDDNSASTETPEVYSAAESSTVLWRFSGIAKFVTLQRFSFAIARP